MSNNFINIKGGFFMSLLPKELIREIVKKGNLNSAADIQEALKELMKEFIQESLEAELDNQLGYEKYGKNDENDNSRNGYSKKKVKSSFGEIALDIPRDRNSEFESKIIPLVEEWQNRPLEDIYYFPFLDAIHFNVKEDKSIVKKAAYVILGVNSEGKKDVLGIYIGGNESAKFWLTVLNDLKNRGVKDI